MAEPGLDPVPVREAIAPRDSMVVSAVWGRWLEELRRQNLQMQAEIVDLQARVAALEGGP